MKYLALWSLGLRIIVWKICKTLRTHPVPSPSPTYIMYTLLEAKNTNTQVKCWKKLSKDIKQSWQLKIHWKYYSPSSWRVWASQLKHVTFAILGSKAHILKKSTNKSMLMLNVINIKMLLNLIKPHSSTNLNQTISTNQYIRLMCLWWT